MSKYATDKWFSYLNEEILTEGLTDIGLPETIINLIREHMPDAGEKAQTWFGHMWKKSTFETADDGVVLFPETLRNRWIIRVAVPLRQAAELFQNESLSKEERDQYLEFLDQNMRMWSDGFFGKFKKSISKTIPNLLRKLAGDSPQVDGEPVDRSQIIQKLEALMNEELLVNPFVWLTRYDHTQNLIILLNQDPTNLEYVKKAGGLLEAGEIATKVIRELEDPAQIMKKYSDGYFWYDLGSDVCKVEAERMGHCGRDERASLFSLRRVEKGKKFSSSYVTVAYNPHDEIVYQIKGRNNNAPEEEYWQYIVDFVDEVGAEQIMEDGEHSSDDFEPMRRHLEQNTTAEVVDGAQNDLKKCKKKLIPLKIAMNRRCLSGGLQPRWMITMRAMYIGSLTSTNL